MGPDAARRPCFSPLQVVAHDLGIPLQSVYIAETATGKEEGAAPCGSACWQGLAAHMRSAGVEALAAGAGRQGSECAARGSCWECQGPLLLTHVERELCSANRVQTRCPTHRPPRPRHRQTCMERRQRTHAASSRSGSSPFSRRCPAGHSRWELRSVATFMIRPVPCGRSATGAPPVREFNPLLGAVHGSLARWAQGFLPKNCHLGLFKRPAAFCHAPAPVGKHVCQPREVTWLCVYMPNRQADWQLLPQPARAVPAPPCRRLPPPPTWSAWTCAPTVSTPPPTSPALGAMSPSTTSATVRKHGPSPTRMRGPTRRPCQPYWQALRARGRRLLATLACYACTRLSPLLMSAFWHVVTWVASACLTRQALLSARWSWTP